MRIKYSMLPFERKDCNALYLLCCALLCCVLIHVFARGSCCLLSGQSDRERLHFPHGAQSGHLPGRGARPGHHTGVSLGGAC